MNDIGPLILIVDDHDDARYALERMIAHQGFRVASAKNGIEAIEQAQTQRPSLVLLDLMMPGMDGFEVIEKMRSDAELKYIPIILVTARDSLEDVTRGLEVGADDYVVKPFKGEELLARLRSALRLKALYSELALTKERAEFLVAEIARTFDRGPIVAESDAMKKALNLVSRFSKADAPVLITGASGTGKELVARSLHENSPRKVRPFLARNCAAFSEHLLESELFGHVRGAFTSAVRDQKGIFEAADGGSLFLDEIGELPLSLQPKLLRVLQEGTFTPVGSTVEKRVDVRVITATNRDLVQMIADRTFREDLYYRLNVLNVTLPPLKERPEDIPSLIEEFLKRSRKGQNREPKRLSEDAFRLLRAYSWPGNIRELQNEIERLVILSGDDDTIAADLVSEMVARASSSAPSAAPERGAGQLRDTLAAVERDAIERALKASGWNRSEAAKVLGISRSNLLAKIEGYQLRDDGRDDKR